MIRAEGHGLSTALSGLGKDAMWSGSIIALGETRPLEGMISVRRPELSRPQTAGTEGQQPHSPHSADTLGPVLGPGVLMQGFVSYTQCLPHRGSHT